MECGSERKVKVEKGRVVRFFAAMLPFIVFGLLYDVMRYFPNYEFSEVDIQGLYEAERALFGVTLSDGSLVTPTEWLRMDVSSVRDLLAGVFYLLWVPLPIFFAFFLYFTGRRTLCLRFGLAFLTVNIIGFAAYYIHPAAPPWYVAEHGFDFIAATGGNAAGLAGFDELIGVPVFHTIYGGNSNVFAALPSMHAAYCPVACYYAMRAHERVWTIILAIVSAGIWWTAVYTAHHYCIDVLLGIATLILGLTLYESLLMRTRGFRSHFDKWARWISEE